MVDMRRVLPEWWQQAAEQANVPGSARGIARKSELAITTVQRLIFEGRSTEDTIHAVADVLGVNPDVIRVQMGVKVERPTWYPPKEAQSLSSETQEALDRLILAVAREGQNGRQPQAEKSSDGLPARNYRRGVKVRPSEAGEVISPPAPAKAPESESDRQSRRP